MKLLLCRDMRLGAICTANLNAEKAQAWNIARYRKFEHLLHTATKDDVGYVILFGRLFGSKLVSGEYIDAISNLISRETNIQVITCLTEEDSHRIASASNTPENLHVLWPSSGGQYEDEKICVSQDEEEIYIEAKAEKNRMTPVRTECQSKDEYLTRPDKGRRRHRHRRRHGCCHPLCRHRADEEYPRRCGLCGGTVPRRAEEHPSESILGIFL